MRKRLLFSEPFQQMDMAQDNTVTFPMKFNLSGNFTAALIDPKTKKVKEIHAVDNLITDVGMDFIATTYFGDIDHYIAVGTGTATASVLDTTLANEIDRTGTSQLSTKYSGSSEVIYTHGFSSGSGDYEGFHYMWRFVRTFTEDEANASLTELGVFTAATGGTLVTRQLFSDLDGVPITITKTNTDWLHITYEFRLYPPDTPATGTFLLGSATGSDVIGYTSSVLNVYSGDYLNSDSAPSTRWFMGQGAFKAGHFYAMMSYGGEIQAFASASVIPHVTGSDFDFDSGGGPFGQGVTSSTKSKLSYIPGTFYYDWDYSWAPGVANFGPGGITGFGFSIGNRITLVTKNGLF